MATIPSLPPTLPADTYSSGEQFIFGNFQRSSPPMPRPFIGRRAGRSVVSPRPAPHLDDVNLYTLLIREVKLHRYIKDKYEDLLDEFYATT